MIIDNDVSSPKVGKMVYAPDYLSEKAAGQDRIDKLKNVLSKMPEKIDLDKGWHEWATLRRGETTAEEDIQSLSDDVLATITSMHSDLLSKYLQERSRRMFMEER